MKKTIKTLAALGMFLVLAVVVAQKAQAVATNPAYLDLKVTFTGALSVKVDGLEYSSRTFSAGSNATIVPSSATVTNDATGLTERWDLSVATVAGNGNWAVQSTTNTAPSTDEFALQAVFISSDTTAVCPGPGDGRWDSIDSIVTGAAQMYLNTRYADATVQGTTTGEPDVPANGNMFVNMPDGRGQRGMCVRFYMPFGSTEIGEQTIRSTVTAQNGV